MCDEADLDISLVSYTETEDEDDEVIINDEVGDPELQNVAIGHDESINIQMTRLIQKMICQSVHWRLIIINLMSLIHFICC